MVVLSQATYKRESQTHKLCAGILRSLSSPAADDLLRRLQDGDFSGVVNAKIDPTVYQDADLFARDYAAVSLLRKYSSFPLGIDTASVALDKFLESEAACRQTNLTRVKPYVSRTCGITPETYISYARKRIGNLLGRFSWNDASEWFGFSGGASTRLKRTTGAPFYKFQGKPETTRNNALLSVCAIWSIPLWRQQMQSLYGDDPCNWVTVVEGSRVTTVPKSATTDRTICIEPEMNMFIQRGIGRVIRNRLKSVRIDLNDQTRNQLLARIGSVTGSLTTIDLASASDSIALELVRLLLPHDWFEALCRCRCETVILPCGKKHPLEKISSMGNGYTFELESLIFWGLSMAVLDVSDCEDRRLGIYGDDIVIHNSVADDLIGLLDYCGFKTNVEKTFLTGPFRESCGKHYFYGKDVTPFYCKEPVETLDRKFWIANSYRLWASLRDNPLIYQKTYGYCVKVIPKKHRYLVPYSFGSDTGLWASFDEAVPRYSKWKQSFRIRCYRPRRKRHEPNGPAAVLHWLAGTSNRRHVEEPFEVKLERGETRYVHSRAYLSWWDPAPSGVCVLGLT